MLLTDCPILECSQLQQVSPEKFSPPTAATAAATAPLTLIAPPTRRHRNKDVGAPRNDLTNCEALPSKKDSLPSKKDTLPSKKDTLTSKKDTSASKKDDTSCKKDRKSVVAKETTFVDDDAKHSPSSEAAKDSEDTEESEDLRCRQRASASSFYCVDSDEKDNGNYGR